MLPSATLLWKESKTVKREIRHTFPEKKTGVILDSSAILDEDNPPLPQNEDTIARHDQPWTVAEIIPVCPALVDPAHPETAVEIRCEQVKAERSEGERTVAPAPGV
jgi:hypothetical protein